MKDLKEKIIEILENNSVVVNDDNNGILWPDEDSNLVNQLLELFSLQKQEIVEKIYRIISDDVLDGKYLVEKIKRLLK